MYSILLLAGACVGVICAVAVAKLAKAEISERKDERDIYMGTCSLSATHAVPEEVKDATRGYRSTKG